MQVEVARVSEQSFGCQPLAQRVQKAISASEVVKDYGSPDHDLILYRFKNGSGRREVVGIYERKHNGAAPNFSYSFNDIRLAEMSHP